MKRKKVSLHFLFPCLGVDNFFLFREKCFNQISYAIYHFLHLCIFQDGVPKATLDYSTYQDETSRLLKPKFHQGKDPEGPDEEDEAVSDEIAVSKLN